MGAHRGGAEITVGEGKEGRGKTAKAPAKVSAEAATKAPAKTAPAATA